MSIGTAYKLILTIPPVKQDVPVLKSALLAGRARRGKISAAGLATVAATIGPLAFKSLAALFFKTLLLAKIALALYPVSAPNKPHPTRYTRQILVTHGHHC